MGVKSPEGVGVGLNPRRLLLARIAVRGQNKTSADGKVEILTSFIR